MPNLNKRTKTKPKPKPTLIYKNSSYKSYSNRIRRLLVLRAGSSGYGHC